MGDITGAVSYMTESIDLAYCHDSVSISGITCGYCCGCPPWWTNNLILLSCSLHFQSFMCWLLLARAFWSLLIYC